MPEQYPTSHDNSDNNQQFFRTLLEAMPGGLLAVDQVGTIVLLNERAASLFGYTRDELIGSSIEILLPTRLRKVHAAYRANFVANPSTRPMGIGRDLAGQRKDGSEFPLEIGLSYTKTVEGVLTLAFVTDITERQSVERMLRESEDRFRLLFQSAPEAIIIADKDGYIVDLNAQAESIFGYHRDEIVGLLVETLVPERFRDQHVVFRSSYVAAHSARLMGEGRELWALRKDGSEFPVEVGLNAIETLKGTVVASFVTDITVQQFAEKQLRYQAMLLANVSDAVIATDMNYRIQSWNRGAELVYGWKAEEVMNQSTIVILQTEYPDGSSREEAIRDIDQHGEWKGEVIQRRKDGTPLYVLASLSFITDSQGRRLGLVAVNRDITEQKRAEAEVRRYAERAVSLAELSKSVASVQLNYKLILDLIAERTSTLIGDACVVGLFSEGTKDFQLVAFFHPNPLIKRIMAQVLTETQSNEARVLASIYSSGELIYVPVIHPKEAFQQISSQYWPYIEQVGIHSLLIVPLKIGHEIIGTLGVSRDKPGKPYTEEDVLFLENIADIAALAIRNASLYEEVNSSRTHIQNIARQVVTAQEEERKRLSRELHDEAGQSLTALKLTLQGLKADIPDENSAFHKRIDKTIHLTDATIEHIRMLSHGLRPPVLDTFGLNAVLEDLCEEFSVLTHITTNFVSAALPPLPDTIEIYLFRIVQEALNNVSKHAQAQHVDIRLAYADELLELTIKDDGSGFDINLVKAGENRAKGIGLVGIHERLALLGGTFEVKSQLGQGTILRANIPWKSES